MSKKSFMYLAGNPKTLKRAFAAMLILRKHGHIIKRQEVKAWFGNNSVANHNLVQI